GGGYENSDSGGDGDASGAMHLARRFPADGSDSEVSGHNDGVGMARSLSTSASGGRDMEVCGRIVILDPMVVVSVEGSGIVGSIFSGGETSLSIGITIAESARNKNNLRWKVKDFRGMTFEKVEAKLNSFWKQMEDFIPMGLKEEAERIKRKGLNLEQKSAKKQKTSEEVSEEVISLKEVPKEKNFMHAPVEWKLYDTYGVHHVTSKDKQIFMLVEKDYPLRKGLAFVMISYKLQVENYSQMAKDLILKIYKIANSPRQQGD
nr:hypothetical protein [Tanacetum cinerariifolium]